MTKLAVGFVVALSGCAGTKRSPQLYQADTQRVLETRVAQIEGCYAKTLEADKALGGLVTVTFVVEKKTGQMTRISVDPAKSSAPEAVMSCVTNALNGLVLAPPDANEGHATFAFELRPKPS